MEKIDFSRTGGFPVKQKTFSKLQLAHFEILKAIIGHFGLPDVGSFIISGCTLVGLDISPGMVFIDGDLCYFKGGKQFEDNKIAKIISTEDAAFKNGANYPVYTTIDAAMNENGVPYANFVRVPGVNEMVNQVTNYGDIANIPLGLVIDPAVGATPAQPLLLDRITKLEQMVAPLLNKGSLLLWNKPASQIPAGWQECVDFKGRMPVGMDVRTLNGQFTNPEFSQFGSEGGSKKKAILKANLPNYDLSRPVGRETVAGGSELIYSNAPGNTFTENINSGGGDVPMDVLNPYRVVIFIEYIG